MKYIRSRMISGILLALLSHSELLAQGPPIHTDTAIISGLEGAAVRSFLQSMKKSADGSQISVSMVPVMIPYEVIPNRLLVVGMLPYLDKEKKAQNQPALSTSGWGDLRLLAKYNILQKDALKQTFRMTGTAGIKLPTGKDDEAGIPAEFQLGSGSVDYTLGTTMSSIHDRVGLHGDLFYTVKTEAPSLKFGDILQYDLALGFRLLPEVYRIYPAKQFNLYLELNGQYAAKNKEKENPVQNSGGHTIFISPGVQFVTGRTVLLEASVQIPILENLNGTQPKTDSVYNIGFRWLL